MRRKIKLTLLCTVFILLSLFAVINTDSYVVKAAGSESQSISEAFPDAYFRKALRQYSGTKAIFIGKSDSDKLTDDMKKAMAQVTDIDLTDASVSVDVSKIKKSDGLKYFTSLKSLSLPADGYMIAADKTRFYFSMPLAAPKPSTSIYYNSSWKLYALSRRVSAVRGSYVFYRSGNTDVYLHLGAVKVLNQLKISSVTLNKTVYGYTGARVEPLMTVKYGDTVLTKNVDYRLTLTSAVKPGTATVEVTGINKYKGSFTKNYTIKVNNPVISVIDNSTPDQLTVKLSNKNPSGTVNIVKISSNSAMISPRVVTSSSSNILIDNLKGGKTYYVKVQSKYDGKYTDVTAKKTVNCLTKISSIKLRSTTDCFTYTGTAIKPEINAYNGTSLLVKGTDYTVSYFNNIEAGKGTIIVKGKGKYAGTYSKSFYILPLAPTFTKIDNAEDGGKLTVYYKTSPGVKTTRIYYSLYKDFHSYKSIDAIDGKGVIKGLNQNTKYYIKMKSVIPYGASSEKVGTSSVLLSKITKYKLSLASVSLTSKLTYTGSYLTPTPIVSISGKKLIKDTDYKLTYLSNLNVGTATVKITGTGDYAGVLTRKFDIAPKKPVISSTQIIDGVLTSGVQKSTGATGVELEFATNRSFSGSGSVSSTTTSVKKTGLQVGTNYYVRARAYYKNNDTVIYGDYTDAITVKSTVSINTFTLAVSAEMRKSPKSSSSVIKVIPKNAAVKILDDSGYFLKIKYNGTIGYISSYVVGDGSHYTAVTNKKISVYSKATMDVKLAELAENVKITVLDVNKSADRAYVELSNGSKCYIKLSAVTRKIRDGSAYTGDGTPKKTPSSINASTLNIRSGPGTSYDSIALLAKGTRVNILDQSNSSWSLVLTSSGKLGYCYTSYLSSSSTFSPMFGIDISCHNGDIDFTKIKDKIDFVIIRCGYGSDYYIQDDTWFLKNVQKCEALGIPYGVYLYSYANTTEKAKSEAEHTLRLLKSCHCTLGVWYDLEDSIFPYDIATAQSIVDTYTSMIKNAGYKVGIYTYLYYYNHRLAGVDLHGLPIWMAQYSSSLDFAGKVDAWQFTSGYTFSEISGVFDANWAYRSFFE